MGEAVLRSLETHGCFITGSELEGTIIKEGIEEKAHLQMTP